MTKRTSPVRTGAARTGPARTGAVPTGRRRIAGERSSRPAGEERLRLVEPPSPPVALEGTRPPAPPAEPGPESVRVEGPTGTPPPRPEGAAPGRGPSTLALAALAVVAALVVAAAAYFAVPAWRARAVERADQTAPSVAERAAAAILSYDYTSLDHDEKAAAGYMTPAYRKKYEHTFTLVRSHAPEVRARVTARVLGSGVSEADGDHAHVLLFVDQTTRSTANAAPQVALNRVMFDMVRQDGTWRVNGITAY